MRRYAIYLVLLSALGCAIWLRIEAASAPRRAEPAPVEASASMAPMTSPVDYAAAVLGGDAWMNEAMADAGFVWGISDLLSHRRYDALERLGVEMRARPGVFLYGWSGFQMYVAAIETLASQDSDGDLGRSIEEWRRSQPSSKMAPLVAAAYLLRARKATPEQQEAAIRAAQAADPDLPQPWVVQIQWLADHNGSAEEVERAFGEAVRRDPDAYPAYCAKLIYMLGARAKRADVLAFLERAAKDGKARHGDAWYALLVWHEQDDLRPRFDGQDVSWDRVRQGFLDFARESPHSTSALNAFARMARKAGDVALARMLVERMGDDFDTGSFPNGLPELVRFRRTLDQEGTTPVKPADIAYAPSAVPFPEAFRALSAERRRGDFQHQVNELMIEGVYDPLEKVADAMRADPWYHGKAGSLSSMYEAFRLGDWFSDSQGKMYLGLARAWVSARPKSPTAKVALAKLLVDLAWKARGSGYADTVTEEGWRGFKAHLQEAEGLLVGVDEAGQDPEASRLLLVVAMGESWSTDRRAEVMKRAMSRFPRYLPLYTAYSTALLPRWGGAIGAQESFALEASRATRSELGLGVYALVALNAAEYEQDDLFHRSTFEWPLIRQGVRDLVSRHLLAPGGLQEASRVASLAHDDKARDEFARDAGISLDD